jgi:hypothetical protein
MGRLSRSTVPIGTSPSPNSCGQANLTASSYSTGRRLNRSPSRARRNGMSAMARGQDLGRGQRFRAASSSKPAQEGLIGAGLGSHKYLKILNSFTLG